jgi:hypothetical protein
LIFWKEKEAILDVEASNAKLTREVDFQRLQMLKAAYDVQLFLLFDAVNKKQEH